MSLTLTYTTLKAALVDNTDDEGTEFAAALDTIIALGELKLLRDLDLEIFDVTDTGTLTGSSQLVTKPTGYIAGRSLHITVSGVRSQLFQRTYEYLVDYWPTAATTTTTPKYYAELNDTQWYVAGTPAGSYDFTARFMKRPTGLSGSTETTWLSTYAADMLLYACLASAEEYLKADERVAVWKNEYAEKLTLGRHELRRMQRADYTPVDVVSQPKGQQ